MMVEVETGNAARAEELYRRFFTRHAEESLLLDRVRDGLGEQALLLGGLPPFRADVLGGGTVGPDVLAGKVAVLDFWATWCEPCVEGFPSLQRIAGTYGDRVELIGVNLDWGDDISPEDLQAWIAGRGLPGRHLHDGLAWDSEMVRRFGVREIPFTVVVGKDGRVLAVNRHGKQLEKAVRHAMRTP
jgi:thiol-disulfide isomerase/thioredoxin